eukprot:624578-Pelagomonas_calceolata.AAC.4
MVSVRRPSSQTTWLKVKSRSNPIVTLYPLRMQHDVQCTCMTPMPMQERVEDKLEVSKLWLFDNDIGENKIASKTTLVRSRTWLCAVQHQDPEPRHILLLFLL